MIRKSAVPGRTRNDGAELECVDADEKSSTEADIDDSQRKMGKSDMVAECLQVQRVRDVTVSDAVQQFPMPKSRSSLSQVQQRSDCIRVGRLASLRSIMTTCQRARSHLSLVSIYVDSG
nr:hypothetical protein Iba_chr12dCG6730 [Ipomoea batatas]